jgi:hypothetical protein
MSREGTVRARRRPQFRVARDETAVRHLWCPVLAVPVAVLVSPARVDVPTRGRHRWGRHHEPPTRFGHHDAPVARRCHS